MAGAAAPKLLNAPDAAAADMLAAAVRCAPPSAPLAVLDPASGHKVALRADMGKRLSGKVAVISGGGSGHEPSHVGWIGEGMLAAAVCGEVFASPSAAACVAAGRTCAAAGCSGVLFVIKNYTGDRLNFGFAVETLKSEGVACDMVVVGEDCAVPRDKVGVAGRRGLAGTILVHKCAGEAASRGCPLPDVARAARLAADSIATMGVALSTAATPGCCKPERIKAGEIEVGLGIHGEAGAYKRAIGHAREVVGEMLQHINDTYMQFEDGAKYMLVVNSLGATPPGELAVVASEALAWIVAKGASVERMMVGCYMSALDMAGASLSVLRLDNGGELLRAMDAPTSAPAWPRELTAPSEPLPADVPDAAPGSDDADIGATAGLRMGAPACNATRAAILAACDALIAAEATLAHLDTRAGDGDCGATMRRGAECVKAAMCKLDGDVFSPGALAASCASIAMSDMGGTSGALYSILFAAVKAALMGASTTEEASGAAAFGVLSSGFSAGVAAVSSYGGATVGDRTMLDALVPAANVMAEMFGSGASAGEALAAAAAAADAGARTTAGMAARAGRSSYVAAEALSEEDAGARAAAIMLGAAAAAL